jgi:hypothetical protein
VRLETRAEYHIAFQELERLMEQSVPSGEWIKMLAIALENYELVHYPIGRPKKYLCPKCGAHEELVLNRNGDDVCCAKCGHTPNQGANDT